MRFADPKSDIAFKKIFGNENKKEILISFLNAVLDLKEEKSIQEIEILNPYQAPRIKDLKETTLDVKARDKRGITFIVEMQVERQEYFGKRALYYSSKAYISQIEKSIDYPKLNQVIFIGILDFSIFNNKNYLSRHLILNLETYENEIKDLEFNFIELNKFTKKEEDLKEIVDKWIYFIKNAGDLDVVPRKVEMPDEIKEAFDIADRHNWTKEEQEVYEYWELFEGGYIDAINTAKKEGVKEGIEKEEKQIVNTMHKNGLSAEDIHKYTNIPLENIRNYLGIQ